MTTDAVRAANELTAAWAERHEHGETVLSGVGVWVLLAALLSGAAGEARAELENAVGLAADEALTGVSHVASLTAVSEAMRAAMGVWTVDHVPLEDRWVEALPLGVLGRLTGDLEADQRALDEWVVRATNGELRRMPITVTTETLVVLASTIAVRTSWADEFTAWRVPVAHGPWADVPDVQLVRETSDLDCVRVGTSTTLRVEGQEDVDVYLVLGDESASAGAVLAGVIRDRSGGVAGSALAPGNAGPGVEVSEVDSPMDTAQLGVSTVSFAVNASHDLMQDPAHFGLAAASRVVPGHFPGISTEPLAISDARQDATARFSHVGFVAAAVTAMAMSDGGFAPVEKFRVKRVRVTFDRPFGFVAVHRPSELALVAGWVTQPSPVEWTD